MNSYLNFLKWFKIVTRYALRLMILLLPVSSSLAQARFVEVSNLLKEYQSANTDINKVITCLKLSNHYLFKGNRLQADVDSALIFLNTAQQLTKSLRNEDMKNAVTAVFGNYYVITGDWKRGKSFNKKAIDFYHANKKYLQEADCWHQLGNSISDTNSYFAQQKLQSYENARRLFVLLHQPGQTAATLQYIAVSNAKQKRFDTARHIIEQAIQMYKSLHDNSRALEAYNTAAEISESESDQHKQLFYRLELVKLMEATADTSRAAYYYAKLSLVYADLYLYAESLVYILKSLEILKRNQQYDDFYGDLSLAIFDYISIGKPEAALAYLLKTVKEVPPQDLAHKVDLSEMFGNCYAAMKQYAKAEEYYLEMMKMFATTQNSDLYSTREQLIIDFTHYNQVMGNFYIRTGKYKKAGFYFDKILMLPPGSIRPITLSKIHLMHFKVDSASQNFVAAINHYVRHKQIDDSLFNVSRNQQIQELSIKYETEKQSKDLQLKQQNITALTSKTRLQQADLNRASLTRNIIIFSSIVLLALAYFVYRIKQRHNLQLQAQKEEINTQNIQLRKLLAAQQKLVTEKEWLLKEIHHRVKNNLQMVISLLDTQLAYLDNDAALIAIQDSQSRMQAISLIHQKLYQSANVSVIDMQVYINELVHYLRDIFNATHIRFVQNVEPIKLDVTQAVPVGLILNEAITNAIKYAFPHNPDGVIKISMIQNDKDTVVLSVADNGRGVPPGFDSLKNKSLGMNLIYGLAKQLEGSIDMFNQKGVEILLKFPVEKSNVEGKFHHLD